MSRASPFLLDVDRVAVRFGALRALDGVSLRVDEGESVALIGPNGAGKTTLFSVITGELRRHHGVVRMRGRDVSRLPSHRRARLGMARTHQAPRPFAEMTVAENLQVGMMPDGIVPLIVGRRDSDAERELALDVGLSEDDLSRTPGELAMGDLRKLEMARALASSPALILLDEVFAGLSAGEIAQLSRLIARKREEGIAFVIVSHDLRSLEPLVDRAVAINFGAPLAEGGFAETLGDPRVRAAYLGG